MRIRLQLTVTRLMHNPGHVLSRAGQLSGRSLPLELGLHQADSLKEFRFVVERGNGDVSSLTSFGVVPDVLDDEPPDRAIVCADLAHALRVRHRRTPPTSRSHYERAA